MKNLFSVEALVNGKNKEEEDYLLGPKYFSLAQIERNGEEVGGGRCSRRWWWWSQGIEEGYIEEEEEE